MAAASVGVAKPPVMAPITRPKMRTSGTTWVRNGSQRARPRAPSSTSSSGASAGLMVAREDVADIHDAQDQAGHDAADQQAGDRDAGEAAEQHRERRWRDQHVDPAD